MANNKNGFALKLGNQIKRRRLDLKLTQEQLANRLGVEVNTVSRMECGTHMPSLERLEQVSLVLNTPISSLLSEATTNRLEQSVVLNGYMEDLSPEECSLILAVAKKMTEHFKSQKS